MSAWRWIFKDTTEPLVVDLTGDSIRIVRFLRATDYKPAARWTRP